MPRVRPHHTSRPAGEGAAVTAFLVPAGALILTGDHLDVVRYAIAAARREQRRNGLPPSPRLDQLANAVAAVGHPDNPTGLPADDDHMLLSADQAAELLGVSPRTARRLAPGLGGRKVGGTWLLDALAVDEHRAAQPPTNPLEEHP